MMLLTRSRISTGIQGTCKYHLVARISSESLTYPSDSRHEPFTFNPFVNTDIALRLLGNDVYSCRIHLQPDSRGARPENRVHGGSDVRLSDHRAVHIRRVPGHLQKFRGHLLHGQWSLDEATDR